MDIKEIENIIEGPQTKPIDGTYLYRYTFLRDSQTKTVLADLCCKSGFFQEVQTEKQRIETNFVREILFACGIWTSQNAIAIIDALENVKIKKGE